MKNEFDLEGLLVTLFGEDKPSPVLKTKVEIEKSSKNDLYERNYNIYEIISQLQAMPKQTIAEVYHNGTLLGFVMLDKSEDNILFENLRKDFQNC